MKNKRKWTIDFSIKKLIIASALMIYGLALAQIINKGCWDYQWNYVLIMMLGILFYSIDIKNKSLVESKE